MRTTQRVSSVASVARGSGSRTARILALAALIAAGIFVGLGTFTFVYARGYSYLQDDPRACANCHAMQDNYTAWGVSAHRALTCNDCHVPHDLAGKYFTKAEHGLAHSFAFTFQRPQVIQIKPRSLEVVERNCVTCHEAMAANIVMAAQAADLGHVLNGQVDAAPEPTRCTVCHRSVGHGV